MFPYISLGDIFFVPLYTPTFLIGLFIAVLIARRLAPSNGIEKADVVYASVYAAIGLLVGAKFLYFITKLPAIIKHFDTFVELVKQSPLDALSFAFGGLVFYGGLLGGILGVFIYCRLYKVDFISILNVAAPMIPLMHGFGRIGCFLGGCCYGIEYHGFGNVQFPYNELIPELNAVPRFPVQLLEAALNFLMCLVLLYLLKYKKVRKGQLMGIYLLYYTVVRYLLEYLRGDKIRGSVGIFSTSQIISILLLPIGIILVRGKWLQHLEGQKHSEKIE